MNTRPQVLAAFAWAGLMITCVSAGAGRLSGQLVGRVLDGPKSSVISGIALRLVDTADQAVSSTISSDSGSFALRVPINGTYWIAFEHLAYGANRVGPLFLRNDSITTVTLRLAPRVLPLDALTVEVERRDRRLETFGFYERRHFGEGRFVDPAMIEARRNNTAADALGRVPGVRVFEAGTGRDARFRAVTPRCMPTIYLNGSIVAEHDRSTPLYGPPQFDLDALRAEDIAGMEIYSGPATVPLQYGGTVAPCGALLIWTR